MFYTEEDLAPAVSLASTVFGRSGTRLFGKDTIFNVSVATKEFGKLWYGDVDRHTLEIACTVLSEKLNQRVYLFYQDNDFNFTDSPVFFKDQ
jgi:hypothetical protein